MKIGKLEDNYIEINEEARKANLAIFGNKNTGKAFTLIPSLFLQDLEIKNRGITIVVDTPELAWYLYGICKIRKRKVELLKPSVNFDIINKLLFIKEWDYDKINEIYDYRKAIEDKYITIIDMEEERYGEKAVRAASMLLLQLQSVMATSNKKISHSVYIDGAGSYLQFVKNLLKYGDYFGFTTTLFFKSREEIGNNINLIDNYVRNYMVLQGISYEDAKYFGERFALDENTIISTQKVMNRGYGSVLYEILEDKTFKRKVGETLMLELNASDKKEFKDEAAKQKRKKKDKTIEIGEHHYQLAKESAALVENEGKASLAEDIEKDVIDTLGDDFIPSEDILSEDEIINSNVDIPIFDEPTIDNISSSDLESSKIPANIPMPEKKTKNKIERANIVQPKGKEPQLNQRIKGSNVIINKPKEDKYSLLNEFDTSIKKKPEPEEEAIPNIEYLDFGEDDLEDIVLPEIDESDLFSTPIELEEENNITDSAPDINENPEFNLADNNIAISFKKKKHPYYRFK